MRGSFWLKDSLITHILFELKPIIIFSPVANFGDQFLIYSNTYTYVFAKGNDNPIFKPKPNNYSVDNNMFVIDLHHKVHGEFFNL